MPVPDLVYRQIEELCRFLEPSATRLWCVRHVRNLQPVVLKILAGIQCRDGNGSVFLYCGAPFLNAEQYFGRILEQIEVELGELAGVFSRFGVHVPPLGTLSGTAVMRLAQRADEVADAFPDYSGSLVFILDPHMVANDGRFSAALSDLAERCKSPRCKFLVLDRSVSPDMDRLRERGGQDFRIASATSEKQLNAELESELLTTVERR